MPQLRWTLLALGVLFVMLLAWIEHRRQRRQGFTDHAPAEKDAGASEPPHSGGERLPSMFREPALTLPEMRAARDHGPAHELPVVEIEDESLDPVRTEAGRSRAEPPTLSLPVLESGPLAPRAHAVEPAHPAQPTEARKVPRLDTPAHQAPPPLIPTSQPAPKPAAQPAAQRADGGDSAVRAFNEAVFGDPGLAPEKLPDFSDSDAAEEGAIADGDGAEGISAKTSDGVPADEAGGPLSSSGPALATSDLPRITPADVSPIADPIVEWPPDDQRRVVALRLVAPAPERLAGRALRLALASEGFVLGKFQIFHKPDESGRAVLSAASLSKPGTFDLGTMDSQRYGGLSLFAVLPGPRPPLKAFEDLLATARNLNERLQGALQDERGGPLTPTRIASLRESLAAETTS